MITDIDLLTEEECLEVRSVVHDLKEFWIPNHPSLPSYTLGAAVYRDAAGPQPDYYDKAKRYNPILRDRFGWLYERLADTLALKLEASVCYKETFALPGFNIFLSHKEFEQPISPIHCDLPEELLHKAIDGINFSHPISFTYPMALTLAIALPNHGGGLYKWDLGGEEVVGLPKLEVNQLIRSRKKSFHAYTVGRLVWHSGHIVHQIAPGKNLQPDDERITLQGHGLFCQGTWQLYW